MRERYRFLFYGCLVGTGLFLLIFGLRFLDPGFFQWLMWGDPAMNYLGWLFFRDAAWHLPLGANPAYGLPLGSSVVYSDSIPLLALAFKPFSSLLSPTFHYFAFWILTCLMLQAAIAFKLMQRITHDFILCCLGALFFALSPVMLSRLDGHFPLLAHWLLLWGLLLCFAKDFKAAQWVVLLCLAVTIQAYWFVMLFALWIANIVQHASARSFSRQQIILSALALPLTALVMGLSGYFELSSGFDTHGYGTYRTHLLSFFDSDALWSRIIRDIPQAHGAYEGFAFLGTGILILLVLAVIALAHDRQLLRGAKPYIPTIVACGLLMFYAISNRVAVGSIELLELPLPQSLIKLFSLFRSTGRFVWPLTYLIYVGVLYIIFRRYKKALAITLLGLAILVQLVDMKPALKKVHNDKIHIASQWHSPLVSNFWRRAARRYNKIICVPSAAFIPHFEHMTFYAALNHIPINVAYLARHDKAKLERSNSYYSRQLSRGEFEERTLYYFRDRALWLRAKELATPYDYAAIVDNVMVLAPRWLR